MANVPRLESLPRADLLAVAHEYMLTGMLVTGTTLPQIIVAGGELGLIDTMAIDEWMGASPVYTGRMRRLMGIDGDDIAAIMKALQLDVGFVHQYMDVRYTIQDEHHGEFALAHCGALLSAEPHGEERVFAMCHTIEDPTFDATALATNPRARIRPIHRPPRVPSDRQPHCHWTITIDPENEPVGPVAMTERVATLPLARVANASSPVAADDGGATASDYRGAFEPFFRLGDLTSATLAAVAREFQMQSHLLVASMDLALREHFDDSTVESMMTESWLGASWIAAERLARAVELGDGVGRLSAALALTPALPPGFRRTVSIDGDQVHCTLVADDPELLDPHHPGWCGALARGDAAAFEGTARALGFDVSHCHVEISDATAAVSFRARIAGDGTPEPDIVAIARLGRVANWTFETARP
jgi:hypothetical protein